MMPSAGLFRNVRWVVFLALLSAPRLSPGQFIEPASPELWRQVVALLNDGKTDDARTLLKEQATNRPGASDVADVMFMMARFLFTREKYDDSLILLREITDKFPDAPAASLAWCGIGQVYEKKGDDVKMIAALERGMAARRTLTRLNIMDATDTHSYASERLGNHYIKTGQWAKALTIYTDWKPSSWCGTCLEGMQCRRLDLIRLCQSHLGQFSSVIEQAWRQIGSDRSLDDELCMFVLVRLYAEAEQLDDLRKQNLLALEAALRQFPVSQSVENESRVRSLLRRFSAMADAIDKAQEPHTDNDLDFLRTETGTPSVVRHVARWNLFCNRDNNIPDIEMAVIRSESYGYPYLELLATIDSEKSRNALVDLAINGDIGRQQGICGFIRHWMKDPEQLIARIAAGVPEDRANHTNANFDGKRFEFSFYEDWTRPAANSLPKSLPKGFLEDQAKAP
jgi:hypothetical protein